MTNTEATTTATVVGVETVTKGMFEVEMLTLDVPEHGHVSVQLHGPLSRTPQAGDVVEVVLLATRAGTYRMQSLDPESTDAMADTGRVFRYVSQG